MEFARDVPHSDGIEPNYKSSCELLSEINNIAVGDDLETGDISVPWAEFRDAIKPKENPEAFTALQRELKDQGGKEWVDGIYDKWIAPDKSGGGFTRLAAIRMLASIGGRGDGLDNTSDLPRYVFDKLWQVIEDNKNQSVDARAWALFSLHYCNIKMGVEIWNDTFGKFVGPCDDSSFPNWLKSIREAIVRSRTIEAIGMMAKNSATYTCWNPTTTEECCRKLDRCRLACELFPIVEKALITHWKREIDYSVTVRMIDALGYVAGWSALPNSEAPEWDVITVLNAAADIDDEATNAQVAYTIRRIALNIIHRLTTAPDDISFVIQQLIDLSYCLIRKLQQAKTDGDTFGPVYNQQRSYLLTLRAIALHAYRDRRNEAEPIVDRVVDGLLSIADGNEFYNAVPLRRAALRYLDDIATKSNLVTIQSHKRLEEYYKLMLADPQPEIAMEVAGNFVNLMGDQDAANYFVDVILDDNSTDLDKIVQYRRENWSMVEDHDEELVKWETRRLVASHLGSINNSAAAFERLVNTLRDDPLRSGRAREALITIGGERAVDSLVEYNLQQQVNDHFFKPMEKAREEGWEILGELRQQADKNYDFTYWAALLTALVGLILISTTIISWVSRDLYGDRNQPVSEVANDGELQQGDSNDPGQPISASSNIGFPLGVSVFGSLGLIIAAFAMSYFWEPTKGLQKVTSELARLIMSFENYLARMRLIGLGFAHAYTQQKFEQVEFLSRISEMSAMAMRESAVSMDIGDYPDMTSHLTNLNQFAAAPSFIGKSLTDIDKLAMELGLNIDVVDPVYCKDIDENVVVGQNPEPGQIVAKGTTLALTPSTNRLPIIKVPNLQHMAVLAAISMASEEGLLVERLDFEFSRDIDEGTVIRQNPHAEFSVAKGTSLTLVISKYPED